MTSTKLAQLLESSRWAPYKLGTLASLPVAAVLMLFWIYYPIVAVAFSCLYMFWGLDVFNKTPLRKMIAWALFLGTALAFGIWYYLIFYPRIGLT